MKRSLVLTTTLMLLTTAACGDGSSAAGSSSPPSDSADLRGTTFLSVEVTEAGSPKELVRGTQISLTFTDDGQIGASAGCNYISGKVALSGGRLRVGQTGTTLMGCPPGLGEQEQWLTALLEATPTWALAEDTLTLTAGSTQIVLRNRKLLQPDQPVSGSRWVVTTLVQGAVASSLPAGANEAVVVIDADGSFRSSTGCRELSGTATIEATTIRFDQVPASGSGPCEAGAPAVLDEAVVRVLGGDVTYSVDGSTLTLTNGDGNGLVLEVPTP